jgi:hypothetical protein
MVPRPKNGGRGRRGGKGRGQRRRWGSGRRRGWGSGRRQGWRKGGEESRPVARVGEGRRGQWVRRRGWGIAGRGRRARATGGVDYILWTSGPAGQTAGNQPTERLVANCWSSPAGCGPIEQAVGCYQARRVHGSKVEAKESTENSKAFELDELRLKS